MALTLWVSDGDTDKIYHIQNAGTLLSSFTVGVFDASAGSLDAISIDYDGTLWVSDKFTDKIYHIQNAGTLLSSFSTSTFDASAKNVYGISAANDKTLWACDINTEKIYHIKTTGELLSSFPTTNFDITATGPTGITSANDGTLWISDSISDKVYNVSANHKYLGMFSTSAFDVLATNPMGISVDSDGTLWVCDSVTDKIYHIQNAGTLLSSFSTSAFDASATSPRGISVANDGTLWVCDSITDKIYHIQNAGTLLSSFSTSAFDALATSPQGISVASDGTLWICDANTVKIYHIQNAGTLLSSFTTGVFDVAAGTPQGISVDHDGTLWICDATTDKIYHIRNAGTLLTSFSIGVFDIDIIVPSGVSKANDGTLWITDATKDRIIHVQPQGALISSFTVGITEISDISIAQDNTLWIIDQNSDTIYNIKNTGSLISSFSTSVFDVNANSTRGISVAYSSTNQLTKRSNIDIFRRISIKRRLKDTSGNYEESWQDISAHIIKWGSIRWNLDKEKYNFFSQRGVSITVKNDEKLFNEETHSDSFWNGYLTRYRTLIKIEAGFIDPDDSNIEIPYPSSLFYGYITEKIKRGDNNKITFQCKSLYSTLDEIPASKIGSINGSLTSSEIIGRIKDMTDGSGFFIFRKYFSANAWNIETTTNTLTALNTSTMLDNLTCWGLAKKLAEAENKIVYIDRYKKFNFVSRTEGTATFSFVGNPTISSDYGHTIKSIKNFQQDIDTLHNRIRIKFGEDDTSTSYVTKEESWSVGDLSSTSWIYGVKTLSFENVWMTNTVAEKMASALLLDLNTVKAKCDVVVKFIPHLDLLDKVTIQYDPKENNMYNFSGNSYKIIGISHNLDKLESIFTVKEI